MNEKPSRSSTWEKFDSAKRLVWDFGGLGGKIELGFTIMRAVMLVFGPLFIAVALMFTVKTNRFIRNATSVNGTILGFAESRDNEDGTVRYCPIVSYIASDAKTYEFRGGTCSKPAEFSKGEQVSVLCKRGDPMGARIHTFWQLWLLPAVFGGMGLVFASVGLGMVWFGRWRDRRAGGFVPKLT